MSEYERAKRELVVVSENRMILHLPKISEALRRLHSILAHGYIASDMTAAIVELRSAANNLENIQKEWPE